MSGVQTRSKKRKASQSISADPVPEPAHPVPEPADPVPEPADPVPEPAQRGFSFGGFSVVSAPAQSVFGVPSAIPSPAQRAFSLGGSASAFGIPASKISNNLFLQYLNHLDSPSKDKMYLTANISIKSKIVPGSYSTPTVDINNMYIVSKDNNIINFGNMILLKNVGSTYYLDFVISLTVTSLYKKESIEQNLAFTINVEKLGIIRHTKDVVLHNTDGRKIIFNFKTKKIHNKLGLDSISIKLQ